MRPDNAWSNMGLKPIFHWDAKPLALGPGAGLYPQRHNFLLGTNMLVCKNAKICITPNTNSKICVTPNAKPQPESVEYRLRWVPNAKFSRWPCTFHVVYPFFFALGTQRERCSQWNMDFRVLIALCASIPGLHAKCVYNHMISSDLKSLYN